LSTFEDEIDSPPVRMKIVKREVEGERIRRRSIAIGAVYTWGSWKRDASTKIGDFEFRVADSIGFRGS